jgi:hypothetical protein
MRGLNFTTLVLAGCLGVGVGAAQTVGQDLKNAGHDTAHATSRAAHNTAHATSHAAHHVGHATSHAARKTTTGTRNVGRRVEGKPTVPNHPQ